MKPTMQEDMKNDNVAVILQGDDQRSKTESSKRFIARAAIALLLLVIGSSIVLAAVYLGALMAKENLKEYHATIHQETGKTQSEKLTVTDSEEEFEIEGVRVIYDFNTGFVAYKWESNDHGRDDCYVASFNMSEIESPEQIRSKFTKTEIYMNSTKIFYNHYEVTDIWINAAALGPRSRALCDGKNIYFLRQNGSSDSSLSREKREVGDLWLVCVCQCCRCLCAVFEEVQASRLISSQH